MKPVSVRVQPEPQVPPGVPWRPVPGVPWRPEPVGFAGQPVRVKQPGLLPAFVLPEPEVQPARAGRPRPEALPLPGQYCAQRVPELPGGQPPGVRGLPAQVPEVPGAPLRAGLLPGSQDGPEQIPDPVLVQLPLQPLPPVISSVLVNHPCRRIPSTVLAGYRISFWLPKTNLTCSAHSASPIDFEL